MTNWRFAAQRADTHWSLEIGHWSFGLPVHRVLAAPPTILGALQPVRRVPLVLGGGIVPALALPAGQGDDLSHGRCAPGFPSGPRPTPAPRSPPRPPRCGPPRGWRSAAPSPWR